MKTEILNQKSAADAIAQSGSKAVAPVTLQRLVNQNVRVPKKTGHGRWSVTVTEIHHSSLYVKVFHEGSKGPQKPWWVKVSDLIHPRKMEPLITSR